MGILVSKAYPTALFANLADHTYVECLGGGKGWSCWGGKVGGRIIGQGTASTNRADCIAKPDEKAGIRCYLVNGVCHQAANRILIEARITVRKARGSSISTALFGTYGRRLLRPCAAPFDRCAGVTGDLPACSDPPSPGQPMKAFDQDRDRLGEAAYVEEVLELYAEDESLEGEPRLSPDSPLQIRLFLHFARYQLEDRFEGVEGRLLEIRSETEERLQQLHGPFGKRELDPREYIARFENLTMWFQDTMAGALAASDYRALFSLHPDERVSLVDPRIVQAVYGV